MLKNIALHDVIIHALNDFVQHLKDYMNVEKALNIIENATEIHDGLIIVIGQGMRVLDCAQYVQDANNEVYVVKTYVVKEEKTDQQGMLNFSEMNQGYQFDDYDHLKTNYFPTSKEMHAFLMSESAAYNHF